MNTVYRSNYCHLQLNGNRFCDEKNDWLEAHRESASVEEIYRQKGELEELLKPMLSKLEDTGMEMSFL